MSDIVSQETIAAILSNAYRSFAWGKRAYTWKTMLGYIRDIALEEFQLSLADLEASSRKLASEMTREQYDTALKNSKWQTNQDLQKIYNSIPYIFSVGKDNIITVVFNDRKRSANCPIQELTTEMMEIIKYMGLVIMYIPEKTKFTIPFLPDNVVHLEIDDYNVLAAIDANSEIAFPRFLRGFIDTIGEERRRIDLSSNFTYTTRLSSNLFRLKTSCKDCSNLPSTLLEYSYINNSFEGAFDLPNFEFFPVGIESIKFLTDYERFSGYIIVKLYNEIIKPPKKMQYLEIPLGHILMDNLVFGNIHTLCINWFQNALKKCSITSGDYTGNLIFNYDLDSCMCRKPCNVFEYNTKVILEDGLEHLIIIFYSSTDFIKLIDYAPSSLKLLTVKDTSKYLLELCKVAGCNLETGILSEIPQTVIDTNAEDYKYDYIYKLYSLLLNFQKKYPHVSIKFEIGIYPILES